MKNSTSREVKILCDYRLSIQFENACEWSAAGSRYADHYAREVEILAAEIKRRKLDVAPHLAARAAILAPEPKSRKLDARTFERIASKVCGQLITSRYTSFDLDAAIASVCVPGVVVSSSEREALSAEGKRLANVAREGFRLGVGDFCAKR